MYSFVAVPEWSTARNACPSKPPGLIPPPTRSPPMSTGVTWSKTGVWFANCALLERAHRKSESFAAHVEIAVAVHVERSKYRLVGNVDRRLPRDSGVGRTVEQSAITV